MNGKDSFQTGRGCRANCGREFGAAFGQVFFHGIARTADREPKGGRSRPPGMAAAGAHPQISRPQPPRLASATSRPFALDRTSRIARAVLVFSIRPGRRNGTNQNLLENIICPIDLQGRSSRGEVAAAARREICGCGTSRRAIPVAGSAPFRPRGRCFWHPMEEYLAKGSAKFSARNGRAATASFERVLAAHSDDLRATYGLAWPQRSPANQTARANFSRR